MQLVYICYDLWYGWQKVLNFFTILTFFFAKPCIQISINSKTYRIELLLLLLIKKRFFFCRYLSNVMNFMSANMLIGVTLAKWHCSCLNELPNLKQTGGRSWKLLSKHSVGFQWYSHSESFYQHVRAARGRIFSLTWFLNVAALCATRAKKNEVQRTSFYFMTFPSYRQQ